MARLISANRLYQLPPEVKIISSVEHPGLDRIDITVELPPQDRICPRCGSHCCTVKESGKIRTVRHLPAANRSVFVVLGEMAVNLRDFAVFRYPISTAFSRSGSESHRCLITSIHCDSSG
ncbi:MAG: transposase family protein [Clostridiales bacterium]|nr:transposase family protein [Clostridiales bacterium]